MIGKREILWYNYSNNKRVKGVENMKNFIEEMKLKKLLKEEKKTNPIVVILIVIGVIVVVAAAAYALYRFFAPDYLEDFEGELEDEFDEDFFEDDEIVLEESVFEE